MSVHTLPLRTAVLGAALSISALFAAPAQAFADDEARRAILELREQVKQLTDQSRQVRLQQADQIEMLQQEIAKLRGQVEQLNWQTSLQQRSSQDQSGGAAQVADPQEQAAFEGPMGLFRAGKYQEAASSFGQFLQSYPDSQLAPQARFYQGSSRYASKDFKGSIQGLQQMVSVGAGVLLLLSVIMPRVLHRIAPTGRWTMLIARLRGVMARNLQRTAPEALFLTGMLNGLLPCGLLYAALLGAAADATALGGALFMLCFGLGTWPALITLRMGAALLTDRTRSTLRKASPVLVAVVAVLMMLRGMGLGIPYLSPAPPAVAEQVVACH